MPTYVADGGLTAMIGDWASLAQKTFLFLNKHFEIQDKALRHRDIFLCSLWGDLSLKSGLFWQFPQNCFAERLELAGSLSKDGMC